MDEHRNVSYSKVHRRLIFAIYEQAAGDIVNIYLFPKWKILWEMPLAKWVAAEKLN